jgi:hypothetical protein
MQEDGLYCQWTAETWYATENIPYPTQFENFTSFSFFNTFWITTLLSTYHLCVLWNNREIYWLYDELLFSWRSIQSKCPPSQVLIHRLNRYISTRIYLETFPKSLCIFSCLQISNYTIHLMYGSSSHNLSFSLLLIWKYIVWCTMICFKESLTKMKSIYGFEILKKEKNKKESIKLERQQERCHQSYNNIINNLTPLQFMTTTIKYTESVACFTTSTSNAKETLIRLYRLRVFLILESKSKYFGILELLFLSPHFITSIKRSDTIQVRKGLAKGLHITCTVEVTNTVKADDGTDLIICTPAYYVPQAAQRILSPQAFFQYYGKLGSSEQNVVRNYTQNQ